MQYYNTYNAKINEKMQNKQLIYANWQVEKNKKQ